MKKIFFFIVCLSAIFIQNDKGQDTTQQNQLSQLLKNYYHIKDALVDGSGEKASVSAVDFIKVLNTIDYKIISEGNVNALLKDATPISETTDLNRQRTYFSNLSDNMTVLAKAIKLTSEPVYQAYCPMKNANWLSSDKAIKNPYYGSMMLTCGEVIETISH